MIGDDDLSKLDHELKELYQVAKDADIDEQLKRFILEHITTISDAIADVQIKGTGAVQKEMKAALAEVAVDPSLREKIETSDLGRHFWLFLERYLLLFGVIMSPFQALQIANAVFPGLNPPSAEAQPMNEKPSMPGTNNDDEMRGPPEVEEHDGIEEPDANTSKA